MSARTHFVTTVTLCDASGRMVWTSSPNPAYEPGPYIWEYASPADREACKNAISRAVVLRETQEFDAATLLGEHYHVWVWPLNSPELAVCVLAMQVPAEMRLLSPRERTSLELLAEGRTTSEIAAKMDVSVSTVHTHFRRARKKLKLRSVEGLIGFAARYCYPAAAPLANSTITALTKLQPSSAAPAPPKPAPPDAIQKVEIASRVDYQSRPHHSSSDVVERPAVEGGNPCKHGIRRFRQPSLVERSALPTKTIRGEALQAWQKVAYVTRVTKR